MNIKLTPKDFFVQLGVIATFYASTIALITLLFSVINYAYPKVGSYYYSVPSISLQVAILIVAFPLFLGLSRLVQRMYEQEPALREFSVRRIFSYLTLFIAGAVVAGDLVTVIYMFLDGQELTTGFLLKVLVLLVIAGSVFFYYLRDLKNIISRGERNIWRIVASAIILISIVIGFAVIGSPKTQRERRYDNERVSDLQTIQWQIVNRFQQKGTLPTNLAELEDSISGFVVPTDPATDAPYVYKLVGQSAKAFQLCATFDRATDATRSSVQTSLTYPIGEMGETWEHTAGVQCFDRSIDSELYPVMKR